MKNIFGYKNYSFNFVGRRKLWYIIALCVIIPGLLVLCFAGLNQGIDFTGGTYFIISYEEDIDIADVRDMVSGHVTQTPNVNEGNNESFTIKTEQLTNDESDALLDDLATLGTMTIDRNELVGPVIGSELLRNARWALIIAGILMLLYITIRFKFNFAITAIAALCHDVLVLLSIFAIFRVEVNSYFIAAVLTILGYSINNTIVVYDRIRENLGRPGNRSSEEIVNASINETLTRSINTSVAVLILLLCLLFFGGDTTRNFVLGMTVGVVAGFFSSSFLAGNLLLDISKLIGYNMNGKRIIKKNNSAKKTAKRK